MAEAVSARNTKTPVTSQFKSFDEFWRYYLKAHARPQTRAMHVLGTSLGILGIASWLKTGRRKYLAAGLVGSYGSAWIGHFAFEGNHPAAFENPIWSLEADLRMYRLWLTGELDDEIIRVLGKDEETTS